MSVMQPLDMSTSLTTLPWYPVALSAEVRSADNIVASFAGGVELALWRSAEGAVQVWENRCPHRGVRFTLGQVVGDQLSCAYHGWQYSAGTGQCAAIPAHPAMPAPRNVCAKVYVAAEADGMIWVSLETQVLLPPPPTGMVPPDWHFCRTLTLRSTNGAVRAALEAQQLRQACESVWRGTLDGIPMAAVVLDAQPVRVFIHLWTEAMPDSPQMTVLHAAARRLRTTVEDAHAE